MDPLKTSYDVKIFYERLFGRKQKQRERREGGAGAQVPGIRLTSLWTGGLDSGFFTFQDSVEKEEKLCRNSFKFRILQNYKVCLR